MGNWTASTAERLLLIYRWTPFPAMSGRDPPKRGPPPHQFKPLPFSRRVTPYWAVSGRDPPKRGAATWHQTCCHLVLLSAFATHRGSTTVSSLGSCPLCLSACQGCFSRNTVRNDLCRAHLSRQVGLAQLVEQMDLNLQVEGSTPPRVMCLSFLLAFACKVVRVLLLEGKCIASLQEDPAEDSWCLARFFCATTVQGLAGKGQQERKAHDPKRGWTFDF